jgi:hypothetical protein
VVGEAGFEPAGSRFKTGRLYSRTAHLRALVGTLVRPGRGQRRGQESVYWPAFSRSTSRVGIIGVYPVGKVLILPVAIMAISSDRGNAELGRSLAWTKDANSRPIGNRLRFGRRLDFLRFRSPRIGVDGVRIASERRRSLAAGSQDPLPTPATDAANHPFGQRVLSVGGRYPSRSTCQHSLRTVGHAPTQA